MELTDVVELAVRPCGDCVHSEILRTKCIFGSSGLYELDDTQLYKKLKGTFVRECQSANVYCQIPHVDSLEYLKVDQTIRADNPSAKTVSIKAVSQFEKIDTIINVIAELTQSQSLKNNQVDDVCNECEKYGIPYSSTKELILKLKRQGDLVVVNSKLFP